MPRKIPRRARYQSCRPWRRECGIKIADSQALYRHTVIKESSARKIDGTKHQRLVHRKNDVAIAADAATVAKCFGKSLAKTDTDVLDRVVRIDLNITVADHVKVKASVACKEGEHMVKKAHARVYIAFSASINIKGQLDLGFRGISFYC